MQFSVLLTLQSQIITEILGVLRSVWTSSLLVGKPLPQKAITCILKFKSEPICISLNFIKVAPLVAGYESESQTLSLKIKDFREGDVPTSFLEVIIEQRSEYRPGAGISETYDASIIPESSLALLKRILRHVKKTMFIWISLVLFMMELLFALICCRPVIIIPRARLRDESGINTAFPNNVPAQS